VHGSISMYRMISQPVYSARPAGWLAPFPVCPLAALHVPEPCFPTGYFETVCGFLHEELPLPEDRLPETVEVPEARH
jgi:hypothetical protein